MRGCFEASLLNTVPDDVHCRSNCRTTACGRRGCESRDGTAAPAAAAPAISFPAVGERELRLDLFRGLALWLIFIDHLPPNLLTWFTIRNYGFQRRHRNLHLHLGLHRGVRLRPRDAGVRLRGRDRAHPAPGLADLCRARVPVHDLPRGDFLRRHQLREPALHRRNGHHGFPQAAGRHHRPGAAAAISSRQHGRAAALYRADAVPAADPVADEVEGRRHAGAVGRALCPHLAIRSVSVGLSERLLGLQSVRLAIAVRVRRLVRAGRRPADVADSVVAGHAVDFARLSVRRRSASR